MSNARRGVCLVLAAPSGAGKSSITRALLAREPALGLSISVTTRLPRQGEREGVDYLFRSQEQFDAMTPRGELLEWARVFGHCYGTPRGPVEQALAQGRDLIFDIDWQGHRQLRSALQGDVVGVFILSPSITELADRLRRRGDDPEQIETRMQQAQAEIEHWQEFDYVVINETLEAAAVAVQHILSAERLRTGRQRGLADLIRSQGQGLAEG